MKKINGVFIIPTGLDCSIGGDAGANTQVKLIANCCDNLIVNPNAVNASDLNEMPDNCWYTEGSIIDRFLEGNISLKRPKTFNRILTVANPPLFPDNINAVNAGRHILGNDIQLVELNTPLTMNGFINNDGTAGGEVFGWEELCEQVKNYDFDVLAIHTKINVSSEVAKNYWDNGGVNPWGAVEAIASRLIANRLNKNVAHAPIEGQTDKELLSLCSTKAVKQSMSPEVISKTYLFCVLKGLHQAPQIVPFNRGLSYSDIDFLLTPINCWNRPHEACFKSNIPIIVVKDNLTCLEKYNYPDSFNIIEVENYLEAAGVIMSMNSGLDYRNIYSD